MTRTKRLIGIMLVLSLVVLAFGACGSDDPAAASDKTSGEDTGGGSGSSTEGTVIGVAVGESDVQHQYMILDSSDVAAGEVTFSVTNEGVKTHEFVILATDLGSDKLEMNGDEANEDAYEVVDEIEDIPGGETADLTVTLEPGNYVLICNVEGHYRMGMRNEITVS